MTITITAGNSSVDGGCDDDGASQLGSARRHLRPVYRPAVASLVRSVGRLAVRFVGRADGWFLARCSLALDSRC